MYLEGLTAGVEVHPWVKGNGVYMVLHDRRSLGVGTVGPASNLKRQISIILRQTWTLGQNTDGG